MSQAVIKSSIPNKRSYLEICQKQRIERKFTFDVIETTAGNSKTRQLRVYENASLPQTLYNITDAYTDEDKSLFDQKCRDFIEHLKSEGYDVEITRWVKVKE